MTLLALPAYYASWLPPDTAELIELLLLLNIVFTLSFDVAGVAGRPLVALRRLSWALGASRVIAGLAGGSCGRNEQGVALVAGAPDSLGSRLVCEFIAMPGGDGQDLLLLRLLNSLRLLALLPGCLLLGIPRALLATLVLALQAHLLVSIEGTTAVAASVHTHTDGLLYTRDQRSRSRCSNPLMRLESQSILGEQSTSTLLLHSIAVENWGKFDGCGRLGGSLGSAGRSEVLDGSRTEICDQQ